MEGWKLEFYARPRAESSELFDICPDKAVLCSTSKRFVMLSKFFTVGLKNCETFAEYGIYIFLLFGGNALFPKSYAFASSR